MKGRGFLALLVVVGAVVAAPNAFAATTRIVDDDGLAVPGNCNSLLPTPFLTISAAVGVSAAGDTVRVCPGQYFDNVGVLVKLTIQAQTTGATTPRYVNGCQAPAAPTTAADAIVDPFLPGFPVFSLRADGATLRGFVIRNNAFGPGPGIVTDPGFSGYTIDRNFIVDNDDGIWLDTSTAGALPTSVTSNCIRTNLDWGIESTTSLENASMMTNTFFQNATGGVIASAAPTTTVAVLGNKSYGDGWFAWLSNSATSRISGNIVKTPATGGILVGELNVGLEVSGNILKSGTGDGITIDAGIFGASTGLKVTGNIVQSFTGSGIKVEPTSSTGGTFSGNISKLNGVDGLQIEDFNTTNSITGNILKTNTVHDCDDQTSGGTGTAGTDNTWGFGNIGKTQNRPDLCRKAAVTAPVFPVPHP